MADKLKTARRAVTRDFNTPDRPNIHGVYVGFKEKAGKETGEAAVCGWTVKGLRILECPPPTPSAEPKTNT